MSVLHANISRDTNWLGGTSTELRKHLQLDAVEVSVDRGPTNIEKMRLIKNIEYRYYKKNHYIFMIIYLI
jgi:hypothetical protein